MNLKTLTISKVVLLILTFSLFINTNVSAQAVSINTTGAAPDGSAMLDISSTTSGILIPRMTEAQRTNAAFDLSGTPTGVFVYQTDGAAGFYFYDGTTWRLAAGSDGVLWTRDSGNGYTYLTNATDNVGINTSTPGYPLTVTSPTAAATGAFFNTQANADNYGVYGDCSGSDYWGFGGVFVGGYVGAYGSVTATGSDTYFGVRGIASGGTGGTYGIAGTGEGAPTTTFTGIGAGGVFNANSFGSITITHNNTGIGIIGIGGNVSYSGQVGGTGGTFNGVDVGSYSIGNDAAGTGVVGVGNADGSYSTLTTGTGGAFRGVDGSYSYATGGTGTGVIGVGNNGASVITNVNGSGGAFSGDIIGSYSIETNDATAGTNYYSTYCGALNEAQSDNNITNFYHFGTHGIYNKSGNRGRRSGGVLGSVTNGGTGQAWGSLGYLRSTGTYYGVYGSNAYDSGGGKNSVYSSIGVAGNGSLFGSCFKGDIYGMAVKGERYGLYVSGKQFTNEVITQLSDNGTNERTATYVPTSMTVDIYMKGTGTLVNGKATINFDKKYENLISDKEPVIVTVTPMGQTNGVYLESVKASGFSIAENNAGKSNTSFTWIAVATKKGYENPENPTELLSSEYESNLNAFMHNESDLENIGTPMWWDGTKLNYTEIPDTDTGNTNYTKSYIVNPVINKKADVIEILKTDDSKHISIEKKEEQNTNIINTDIK